MRATAKIFMIICILFLVGTVGASDASVLNPPSKDWVIANGMDQSTITVYVINSTGPVYGATVVFTVNNSVYGSMSPATVITGSTGLATSMFTVSKKSGTANITATISYNDGGTPVAVEKFVLQYIDHDVHQIFPPSYTPGDETVGETITISIPVTDDWGNPIDSARVTDTVSLSVSCAMPNDCEFVGIGHSLIAQPDSDGIITTQLKLGTKIGDTIIVMDPADDLSQQSFMINTIATTPPILTVEITPAAQPPSDIPTLSVTSGALFNLVYTLSDKYGNPFPDHRILVTTSLNETLTLWSNTSAEGQTGEFNIGSPGFAALVDITAEVEDMPSITNKSQVAFANAEPSISLSVAPLNMGSTDYVPPSQADVVVLVRDDLGNPISGQDITLTLDYTWGDNWTDSPYLANMPGQTIYQDVTDSDGRVTTIFTPGALEETSFWQGTADLTATWEQDPSNTPKTVTITWSNRPYVNIGTSISPQTVKVGDTIDVTINISVNGEADSQGPLTVVLDQDATQNLGRSISGSPTTMMEDAVYALKTFIDKLNEANTRMGLETFGKAQTPPVGHLPIPSSFGDVKDELDKLNPLGPATLYPTSLIDSIGRIRGDPASANNVKIIVFVSDGGSVLQTNEFNKIVALADGDGTEEQQIRIMTICYTNNAYDPSGAVQLRDLSAATGGTAYIARNADELAAKFDELIDVIASLCSQDSEVRISFQDIQVNETYTASGSDIYDYVPVAIPDNRLDDLVSVPSNSRNDEARTSIIWPNQTQSIQNQSTQFPNLIFTVGRINLTEEWSTTFSLKVKQVGCYNLFGPTSQVSLGENSATTFLPDTPICVSDTLEETPLHTGTLELTSLQVPGTKFIEFIPMEWDTTYTTNNPVYTVTETLYYRIDGGPEKQFNLIIAGQGPTHQRATLDIRNLPVGLHTIDVRLRPFAKDASHEDLTWSGDVEIHYDPPYIKLL